MARKPKSSASPAPTTAIEQYDHKGTCRLNNPPVGLVTHETDPDEKKKIYEHDPHLDPQLSWAGKAEHTSFEVPTVSLHVHERIDPRRIIRAVRSEEILGRQFSLFDFEEEKRPLREAIEFYKHKHNWSNRLIAGDSLLVMNSLIEKERMAGKVQMIYIDPPYGIKYGSNFQPFVNKRDVTDRKDGDLTQEPEMIKAFRDTWELGIHSYLTYIRDRLLLSRELLSENGNIFVQISDENLHHLRELLDEIFGVENFISLISFRKKTMPLGAKFLEGMYDYLLWYAKDKTRAKYHPIYIKQNVEGDFHWCWYECEDGTRKKMTNEELNNHSLLPSNCKIYRLVSLWPASFSQQAVFPVQYTGKDFAPPPGQCWPTSLNGINRNILAQRIQVEGKNLRRIVYLDEYQFKKLINVWSDTVGARDQKYVVQTSENVIERCLLMTTDPGDLVLDPTCGSGTTAYVAEKWGRRWITCDTSRVSITLAKQRLMVSLYDYYKLSHPLEGVESGFDYENFPYISLKSIANNETIEKIHNNYVRELEKTLSEINNITGLNLFGWDLPQKYDQSWSENAKKLYLYHISLRQKCQREIDENIKISSPQVTLYDQPLSDKSKMRVSGPFTMEAVPSPVVKPLTEVENGETPADDSIARSGESLRQAEWRDELFKTGVRGKGGQVLPFSRIEPLAGTRWLHADGETSENEPKRVVVSFGPEHSPLEQRQVELALEEAQSLVPKPKIVIFAAFQFDPEASKDIDEITWPGVTLLKAQMNADLLTEDLKKKRTSNESFWFIGQPDLVVEKIKECEDKGKLRVEVLGFDYYNTKTGVIESGDARNIAMWMLDTDYDGRSLFPSQVFFPMAGPKDGWDRLARNLKAQIDGEKIEAYRGTISLPFISGKYRRIAVKIVDDRGIESLKIIKV